MDKTTSRSMSGEAANNPAMFQHSLATSATPSLLEGVAGQMRKDPAPAIHKARLATQAEAFDDRLVTGVIDLLDVVKQGTSG
jgi:hypothetical protein